MTKPLLIIDGDELLYRCCIPNTFTVYQLKKDNNLIPNIFFKNETEAGEFLGSIDDNKIELEKVSTAKALSKHIESLNTLLEQIEDDCQSNNFLFCFSGPNNYRYNRASILPYKGNRDSHEKPPRYWEIKKYITENYESLEDNILEADDLLGIKATELEYKDCIIVTQDKDLNMIPGDHYNISKPGALTYIGFDSADLFFLQQLLTGDSTDNIPGIFRVGEKTAQKWLKAYINNGKYDWKGMLTMIEYKYIEAKEKKRVPETKLSPHEIVKEIGELLWIKRFFDKGPWDYWEL